MGVSGVKDGGVSVKSEKRDLFDEIIEGFEALEREREGSLALRRRVVHSRPVEARPSVEIVGEPDTRARDRGDKT